MRYYAYESWTLYRARVHREGAHTYRLPVRNARATAMSRPMTAGTIFVILPPPSRRWRKRTAAFDPTTTTRACSSDAVSLADRRPDLVGTTRMPR